MLRELVGDRSSAAASVPIPLSWLALGYSSSNDRLTINPTPVASGGMVLGWFGMSIERQLISAGYAPGCIS